MNKNISSGIGAKNPPGVPSDALETAYELASQIVATPIEDIELLGVDTLKQILEEIEIQKSEQPRDIEVCHQGTISLFYALTQKGRQWLAAHCPAGPEHQYLADALAVETRYVADLLQHAQEDGLNL